jgi:chorismate synthase
MALRFISSGESHGPAITAILEGFPAGVPISLEEINKHLTRRQKGHGSGDRMKKEQDQVTILGGIMGGVTTGAPIALMVKNLDHVNWKGKPIPPMTIPRPGHADLVGAVKYGFTDLRMTLERSSARETVVRVAAGSICQQLLAHFGIQVDAYVVEIGGVAANLEEIPIGNRTNLSEMNSVRCPDAMAAQKMQDRISQVMEEKDTLGGIIEIITTGLPVGLGTHAQWDRKVEARVGAAILSVQTIKGIEFGPAFENARKKGTEVQDPIRVEGEAIQRSSNRSGGLEGSMTNGQPLTIRAAMKPIATTLTPQPTVDLVTGEQVESEYHRSDHCPVPRAVPVLQAVTAYACTDLLLDKLGGDSLDEMMERFKLLRTTRLSDLSMDHEERIWWPA